MLPLDKAIGESRYAAGMQRLFTMFPAGLPGLALLVLRLCVAAALWLPLLHFDPPTTALCVAALIGLSLSLALGIITPLSGLGCAAIEILRAVALARSPQIEATDELNLIIAAAVALAAALIGPGAYSLDARLFGRRVLPTT